MNSTVMFLDSYHLLNCIWPDSLGERAYNLAKKKLKIETIFEVHLNPKKKKFGVDIASNWPNMISFLHFDGM